MKNRSILFAMVLSIGLFSTACDNDDDNEGETLAPLEGKWNLTKVGTVVAGNEVLTDAPQNESGCSKDYLELKIDNTATVGDYDSDTTPCALTTHSGIYSRSHNDLTTVIDGTTLVEDIQNLTLTQLKLRDQSSGVITVYERN